MTRANQGSNRGKWVAATLVVLAIIAALAEWKWRAPSDPMLNSPPASATRASD